MNQPSHPNTALAAVPAAGLHAPSTGPARAQAEFNRVINHAIEQGMDASVFLRCWREGNWRGCAEFGFEPDMAAYAIEAEPLKATPASALADPAGARPTVSPTPLSDQLEKTRLELGQQRTPAYGDALALCRRLERQLAQAPVLSDAELRQRWATHAAKMHSWPTPAVPAMHDLGNGPCFECGWHESEYQTFKAGYFAASTADNAEHSQGGRA